MHEKLSKELGLIIGGINQEVIRRWVDKELGWKGRKSGQEIHTNILGEEAEVFRPGERKVEGEKESLREEVDSIVCEEQRDKVEKGLFKVSG